MQNFSPPPKKFFFFVPKKLFPVWGQVGNPIDIHGFVLRITCAQFFRKFFLSPQQVVVTLPDAPPVMGAALAKRVNKSILRSRHKGKFSLCPGS